MSSPRFMVFKLKDLRIPIIILLVAIALFIFLLVRNKTAAQTFAPSDTYQDGKYIAGISLSDAEMDLVVEIQDSQITSVSLQGLDENTSSLYKDLLSGIDYVNTYVTATQSLQLPQNASISPATTMLMDAVKVALSEDMNTQITSTYENLNVLDTGESANVPLDEVESNAADTESNTADNTTNMAENTENAESNSELTATAQTAE